MTWGMYGRHFDPPIIEAMGVTTGPEPEPDFPSYPALLQSAGYSTCLVGKWHRGRMPLAPSGPTAFLGAPQARGYGDWVAGAPTNLGSWTAPWERVDGMTISSEPRYATIAQTEAAIAWWAATSSPKMMEVALSEPHPPMTKPPLELLDGYEPDPTLPPGRKNYEYKIRAADHALGQILAAVSPETIFILTSDNGAAILPPPAPAGHGKGTTYEYGVRVPLSIRSWFPTGPSNRLVHVADIAPTILSLAGIDAPDIWDGKTLLGPEREFCLSEALMNDSGANVWDRAAISKTHKLRRVNDGPEEFYRLTTDPIELSALDVASVAGEDLDELIELRGVLES